MSELVAQLVDRWLRACVVQNVTGLSTGLTMTLISIIYIILYEFTVLLSLLRPLVDYGCGQNEKRKASQPFFYKEKLLTFTFVIVYYGRTGWETYFVIMLKNKCVPSNGSSLAEKFPSFIARRLRCLSCIVRSGLVLIKYFPAKLLKFQWTRSCLVL